MRLRRAEVLFLLAAIAVLGIATYFNFVEVNGFRQLSLSDFEIGKVADRDVVVSRDFSFVDENATRIRREARQRLVTAVFRYDRDLSAALLSSYADFVEFVENAFLTASGSQQFVLEVQQQYPGMIEKKNLQALYASPDRAGLLNASQNVFKQIVSEGITTFPDEGMDRFNQANVEIVRWRNDRSERVEVPKETLLTWTGLRPYISSALSLMKKNQSSLELVTALVRPFVKENLAYQSDESDSKLDSAVRQVNPVLVVIHKGQKIIKRGFIITEESYRQLEALASSGVYIDVRHFLGTILCLLALCAFSLYVFSSGVYGETLDRMHSFIMVIAFSLVYLGVLVVSRAQVFSLSIDLAAVLPIALITMLVAALVGQRGAVFFSFFLSFGVLCASDFSVPPALFSLFTGISGVGVMRITGKRIDLVKSACFLAILQPLFFLVLRLAFSGSTRELPYSLAIAATNGFMSGLLVLGFLPILESALNTATSFRLIEFSDLNSPVMKKMLLSISGTYNHSIMVATLAESACREIGADPLLARVGAYYHDIGKMDQSEYFVENQTDYNKHLDLNPRLSATVIRSHVKQGIEKARQLRLPKRVIDIISEHHGNSVISYFYNEAKKIDPAVDPEDFMYPGSPPRSKESAVVMLADVVEAACRTLEKPSVPRLEKFIGELIQKKIETGQLDNSDLTFREIGVIKRTFVNILAGYYHSRIEYPNQKDGETSDFFQKDPVMKGKKHE